MNSEEYEYEKKRVMNNQLITHYSLIMNGLSRRKECGIKVNRIISASKSGKLILVCRWRIRNFFNS
jgi:hypothetical protein